MTEFKAMVEKWWGGRGGERSSPLRHLPQLWRFLVLLGGGIALLLVAGSFLNPPKPANSPTPEVRQSAPEDSLAAEERELETRLEKILGSVAGAGSVQVTVTLASGQEKVFAQNLNRQNRVTEERDQTGGNRKTTEDNQQESLVFAQTPSGGKDDPVVIKAKRPEIAGVLVLSEGARDPMLRERLAGAVVTLLDIPPHKVTVLPRESW